MLKTSVSVKILTGWVVTHATRDYKRPSEADKRKFFEVCHDFLGKRYGFDNIGAYVSTWTKQIPNTCNNKNHQSSMTKRKQIPSFCQGHKSSPNGSKIFSQGFIQRLEREFGFDYVYENKEKMSACLTNPLKS